MIDRVFNKLIFWIRRARIMSLQKLQTLVPYDGLTRERIAQEKNWLSTFYTEYISSVSRADMALSLETASCISAICKLTKPKRILDMGSGFTSFLLRSYALSTGATVVSVDDDERWLLKTEQFLTMHNLPTANMMLLDKFLGSSLDIFDLIVFDLNFVEVRIMYVNDVVGRLAPSGIIFFDDVHKIDYLMNLLEKVAKAPIRLFDLKPVTYDAYSRYTLAGLKDQS